MRPSLYSFDGWYYGGGAEWITAEVKWPNGAAAETEFERRESPDIVDRFGDESASKQRYALRSLCNDNCTIEVQTPDGATASKKLAELFRAPFGFTVGDGTFFVDKAAAKEGRRPTLPEALARRIRDIALSIHLYVLIPLLVIGVLAFVLTSMVHWRRAISNICYVMALVSWILVATRIGLLMLISATSFPALKVHYMAPTYFMLISGAVFSCAAWLQLAGWRPRSAL
jgi:hypothetical protein